MTTPHISVINPPSAPVDTAITVLSYNGLEMLQRCLPSTFDQGTVVLVDNGSADGTVAYVTDAWPHVAIVSIEFNVGLGKALNIGARAFEARHIVLMNNDVIVLPGAIRSLCALLDADPSIGIASPVLLNEDISVQEFGNDLHISGVAARRTRVTQPLLDTFFQSGCVTVVRQDQFLRLGGYGEVFEWYCEDVDLAWRYRNAGLRVVVAEGAQCIHLQGATLGRTKVIDRRQIIDERFVARMYYYNRNFLLLFARNAPWYQLVLQFPFILTRQLIEITAAALTIRDGSLVKAYLRAWRDTLLRLPLALRNVNASMPTSRRSTFPYVRVYFIQSLHRLRDFLQASRRGDDA